MEKDAEGRILARAIAVEDGKAMQETNIGYAISLLMDYGNGRQVTITGTLPLTATITDFNEELDKLRIATNRQQSFVIIRDRKARLLAAQKMVKGIEHMIASYEENAEKELAEMVKGLDAKHSATKQQIINMRASVANFKQNKMQELEQHRSEVEICEIIIENASKEIEG